MLATHTPKTPNALTRIARSIAVAVSVSGAKETTLANCIFDLQLTVAFTDLSKHFGNDEVASLLGFA